MVKELEKEGEKLSDILSMPIKDVLGRDTGIEYSEDIVIIRDILEETISRRSIFIESVDLQILTLEQVTHIYAYESDAEMAIKWIDDLYNVMIKTHSHVGCNVFEIQIQKQDLQTIQETSKVNFIFKDFIYLQSTIYMNLLIGNLQLRMSVTGSCSSITDFM